MYRTNPNEMFDQDKFLNLLKGYLPDGSFIFGSFVRYLLCQKEGVEDSHEDIDIASSLNEERFLGYLEGGMGWRLFYRKSPSGYGYGDLSSQLTKLTFQPGNIQIDYLHGKPELLLKQHLESIRDQDTNVNQLILLLKSGASGSYWEVQDWYGNAINAHSPIMENIRRKIFVPNSEMTIQRKKKLLDKGWKEVKSYCATSVITF